MNTSTPVPASIPSSFWLPLVLIVGGLLLTGCGATAPVVDSISTPDTLETRESGSFEATISNQGDVDEPVTYTWDYGDGSTGSGLLTSKSYTSTGQFMVEFRASNEGGADSASATVWVVRPPQPPSIQRVNARPNPVEAGKRVQFDVTAQGDRPLDYQWSFGDGETASGDAATHTYESAGQYTVRLGVSNNVGEDSRTTTVRVERALPEICMTVSELNSVYFGRNSSTVTTDAEKRLQENADLLSKCPNLSVTIEGYAAPGERNSQSLSSDRAQAVSDFYSQSGIASNRISQSGEGQVSGVTSKKGGTREYRRADSIPNR